MDVVKCEIARRAASGLTGESERGSRVRTRDDRWVCPLGEYGGLRQFASCDAEEEFTSEEIEQYMKTQTEAFKTVEEFVSSFAEHRNPKYVGGRIVHNERRKVVVDGAKKAVKVTPTVYTHIVPPSAVEMAAVAAANRRRRR